MKSKDPLESVVAELQVRAGSLRRLARDSGISYDTILRIKNGENDPGYSRVKELYDYLFRKQVEA